MGRQSNGVTRIRDVDVERGDGCGVLSFVVPSLGVLSLIVLSSLRYLSYTTARK